MGGSVRYILVVLLLTLHHNEGFRIFQRVKEFLHGTTTTTTTTTTSTTELPVYDEVIDDVLDASWKSQPQRLPSSSPSTTADDGFLMPDDPQLMGTGVDGTDRLLLDENTSSTQKTPVPVPVDNGRVLIDAPPRSCGPGQRLDRSGKCRRAFK
ncbi:uncharacterized protein LOC124362071 isoform X2 [Homalodisca vitripennis]|uniref:uncharacterized protein LOC124362071 isoform X2 n=1 Tax=Homalodisca vitripennis TaxID=197043 RepID=UPI001EEBB3EB|nr:uncharacterized protein LOC124362071 isoform X2 [Homalodisca vitripennis]